MYNIYCITNIKNNKKYVGITKYLHTERWKTHVATAYKKKKKYALHRAIFKYGQDSFIIELLENTIDIEREKFWIKKLNTLKEGYNLTSGGDGTLCYHVTELEKKTRSENAKKQHKLKKIGMYGKKHTEESKQKIKDKHLILNRVGNKNPMYGKKLSEKHINILKTRIITDETKLKMSAASKLRSLTFPMDGENNPMFGKNQTEETKKIISEKAKSRAKIKKECPFCSKNVDFLNFNRWHGNNCKSKLEDEGPNKNV